MFKEPETLSDERILAPILAELREAVLVLGGVVFGCAVVYGLLVAVLQLGRMMV